MTSEKTNPVDIGKTDTPLDLQTYCADLNALYKKKNATFEHLKTLADQTSPDVLKKKSITQYELIIVCEKLNNLDLAYQQVIKNHKRQTAVLKSFQEKGSRQLLDRALHAFACGDILATDHTLKDIGQSSNGLKAPSFHLRGEIAEGQIDIQKAFDFFKQAVLCEPHNSTYLDSAGSLAHDLGRHDEAINHFEKALKSDINVLGEDHPQVAARYNNLGVTWHAKGDYDNAIRCYKKSLASDLKSFGESHPNFAANCNNLANTYKAKGDYNNAILYYEKALQSDVSALGDAHPQVATDHNNLGSAWHDKGNYDKAIEYYEKALASDVTFFGEDHPQVSTCYNNLGSVWQDKGHYDKATGYYVKALTLFSKTLGPNHPNTVLVQENLDCIQDTHPANFQRL